MKTIWEYDLPTNEKSEDYLYESPIFVKDKHVYFVSKLAGEQMLHIVDVDSGVKCFWFVAGKILCLSAAI